MRKIRKILLGLLCMAAAVSLTACNGGQDGGEEAVTAKELAKKLESDSTEEIVLSGDVVLTGPVTVTGSKTITGQGTVTVQATGQEDA